MELDINDLRGLVTLLLMVSFVALTVWVYHPKSKKSFDAAAQLPFLADQNIKHTSTEIKANE